MRRSSAGLAISLIAGLAVLTPSAATAVPTCDEGNNRTHIKTWYAGEQWRPTATRSDWGTGGTRVTVSKGKRATNSVRKITASTHSFDLGAEYGPIKANYNYTHSSTNDVKDTTTTTLTTKYTRRVPRKKQARMMRWGIQKLVGAKKYRLVWSSSKNTCVEQVIWRAKIGAPAANGTFIWDMQDRRTGRPGCKLQGYVSYGSCPKIKN